LNSALSSKDRPLMHSMC